MKQNIMLLRLNDFLCKVFGPPARIICTGVGFLGLCWILFFSIVSFIDVSGCSFQDSVYEVSLLLIAFCSAYIVAGFELSLYSKWVVFFLTLMSICLFVACSDGGGRGLKEFLMVFYFAVMLLLAFLGGDLGERKLRLRLKAKEEEKRAELEAVEEALLDDALRAGAGEGDE